jgi:hypothetical protein
MNDKSDKIVTVYGQRLTKHDPIIVASKGTGVPIGTVLDDGTNLPLTLASNFPEWMAESFMANLKSQHPKKVWKFWIS